MIKTPQELKYTASHEWIRQEADGSLTVGITDFAQEALGDIVFIEFPQVGRVAEAGEAVAVVESVKAASDIYAPVAGEIVAVNDSLRDAWEGLNQDAFAAWLFRMKPANAGELAGLLDAAAYAASAEASK
ncbi:MAG: glycine cleavage system protein GcvH [Burkholderiales bacterium]|jgi:glycine cleavage system H protein|nr:glycine cleavage system protein GcvH [Burkholderiales bacterium]